jgi:CBS domain-containing protein
MPQEEAMPEEKTFTEEIKVTGTQLVETVKKLVHEANIRRLIIKNEKGDTVIEIPVSVATVGVLLLPVLAALSAIAAVVTNCTIVVVKTKE